MSAPAGPTETCASTGRQAWPEVLAQAFVPPVALVPPEAETLGLLADRPGRLPAAAVVADLHFSVVSGPRHVAGRVRPPAPGSAHPYEVGVQLRGAGDVRQDGRVARLAPGDLAVLDLARPFELVCDRDAEMLVVVVPRHRLASRAPGLDGLTAVAVSGARGSGALASSLLRQLDPRTLRPGPEADLLSDAAVDLLAACLVGCAGPEAGADDVVAAARRYIEQHLSDPSLTPSQVAAAVHVSLRQLQKLFERRGTTITGWTRERRLERCRHDLGDPRLASRPVAVIAASWGLLDAALFSRAFRARYGTTPREHREGRRAAAC